MHLQDINNKRLTRLQNIIGNRFICWKDENGWHTWHRTEPIGLTCHNYWEMFAWVRNERARRDTANRP